MAVKSKSTAPAFDFSSVKPVAAEAPVRQSGVSAEVNPALPWVRDSWNGKTHAATIAGEQTYLGAGRAVIVPSTAAAQTEALLRRAAAQLAKELGERIGLACTQEENPRVDDNGNLTSDPKQGKIARGMVAVRFAAKTGKRPYTRAKKATPAADATNATTAS